MAKSEGGPRTSHLAWLLSFKLSSPIATVVVRRPSEKRAGLFKARITRDLAELGLSLNVSQYWPCARVYIYDIRVRLLGLACYSSSIHLLFLSNIEQYSPLLI